MRLLLGVLFVIVGLIQPVMAQTAMGSCEEMKAAADEASKKAAMVDRELSEIDRQIADLVAKKNAKTRERDEAMAAAKSLQAKAKEACSICEKYDQRVEALKRSLGPLAAQAREVGREVSERSAEVKRLEEEVNAVVVPYENMKCGDLVPGKTDQATINKCTELFSKWNDLQIRIDKLNSIIVQLQERYRRLLAEIRKRRAEIASLSAEMDRVCKESPKLVELKGLQKDFDDYDKFESSMDAATQSMSRMKGSRLVQPKALPKLKQLR